MSVLLATLIDAYVVSYKSVTRFLRLEYWMLRLMLD